MIEARSQYVFNSVQGVEVAYGDAVAVFDGNTGAYVARVPIRLLPDSAGVSNTNQAVGGIAVSLDGTRAYVTKEVWGATRAAVIVLFDALALQQVDLSPNDADKPANERTWAPAVTLEPDSDPRYLQISRDGTRLFVADRSHPRVYVIDIDPASSTYHTLLKTI